MSDEYTSAGQIISHIPVRISYRIIELFSEGLYSSPTKAIEELVANSFDAGARHVHVLLSSDLAETDANIIVIDDGQSMNEEGLKQHWLIGSSNKRMLQNAPLGRKQIGKFGIGKLATFVLASKLTHICKRDGRYFAATMDYSSIPHGRMGGIEDESVSLPLRELSEEEAKASLPSLIQGNKEGHAAISLFGPSSAPTWTVAIMSELKSMAKELKKGKLLWVLRTAMPLNPDFNLFLDGNPIHSVKMDTPLEKEWVLGKDIIELKEPAPDSVVPSTDPTAGPDLEHGLWHPLLGRITGAVRLYKESISEGKSAEWGRSHGFFVYVRGRLVNSDDPNFGIPANALRHGTITKFRAEIHVDRLDEELRSSRESVREAQLTELCKNVLKAIFNAVRNYEEAVARKMGPGERVANKIQQAPGSLTRRPIVTLVEAAVKGEVSPKLVAVPKDLQKTEADAFIQTVETRAQSDQGLVVNVETRDLPPGSGVALFDVETGTLAKNSNHPFVAAYAEDPTSSDLVSLIGMAEVLTEAFLYKAGLRDDQVRDVMGKRDELLRSFARSSLRRTANTLAQALEDASTDQYKLELEVVAAFDMLGLEAEHLGGSGRPDGIARASIGRNRYAVSLEAKSKENPDGTVSAKAVGVSAVARQRDEFGCDHAVVVAPGFATSTGEDAAVIREARADKERAASEGKTITLIRVHDLARLVRIVSLRPTGLDVLRDLLQTCVSPEESSLWVDKLEKAPRAVQIPYKEVLDVVWLLQADKPDEAVEFAAIVTYMQYKRDRRVTKDELVDICKAMQRIVPEGVVLREQSIELRIRPDRILEIAGTQLRHYPEAQKGSTGW